MAKKRSHEEAKFTVRPTDPFHSKSPAMIDFNVINNVNWKKMNIYLPTSGEWDEKNYLGVIAFIENQHARNTDIDNVEIDLTINKNFTYFTAYTFRDMMVDDYIRGDKRFDNVTNLAHMHVAITNRSHELGKAFKKIEKEHADWIGHVTKKDIGTTELKTVGKPCKKDATKTCCKILDARDICACDPDSSAIILKNPKIETDIFKESNMNLVGKGSDFKAIDRIPRCLQDFKKLESIDLGGNNIRKIENLDGLEKLKFLDLRAMGTGFRYGINQIENIDELKNLKFLILRNNEISEIKNLENNTKLEIIDLTNNYFEKPLGLEKLEELPDLKKIQFGKNYFVKDEEMLVTFTKALESLDMKNPDFKFTT